MSKFVAANKAGGLVPVPKFANKRLAFKHYAKHSKGVILKNGKTKLMYQQLNAFIVVHQAKAFLKVSERMETSFALTLLLVILA